MSQNDTGRPGLCQNDHLFDALHVPGL